MGLQCQALVRLQSDDAALSALALCRRATRKYHLQGHLNG